LFDEGTEDKASDATESVDGNSSHDSVWGNAFCEVRRAACPPAPRDVTQKLSAVNSADAKTQIRCSNGKIRAVEGGEGPSAERRLHPAGNKLRPPTVKSTALTA